MPLFFIILLTLWTTAVDGFGDLITAINIRFWSSFHYIYSWLVSSGTGHASSFLTKLIIIYHHLPYQWSPSSILFFIYPIFYFALPSSPRLHHNRTIYLPIHRLKYKKVPIILWRSILGRDIISFIRDVVRIKIYYFVYLNFFLIVTFSYIHFKMMFGWLLIYLYHLLYL